MVSHDEVRQIALKLPGVLEGADGFGFSVSWKGKAKGFAWTWNERIEPKKPKVPNPEVLAVVVPNLLAKDLLMEESPDKFVEDPHYNNYPAVLVRLSNVSFEQMEDLLIEAWRAKAPKSLIAEFDDKGSS